MHREEQLIAAQVQRNSTTSRSCTPRRTDDSRLSLLVNGYSSPLSCAPSLSDGKSILKHVLWVDLLKMSTEDQFVVKDRSEQISAKILPR